MLIITCSVIISIFVKYNYLNSNLFIFNALDKTCKIYEPEHVHGNV